MPPKTKIDPSDGLVASEAQEWAVEKHDHLRRYLDISHPTRRKFLQWGGATYFELFAGPGRSFIKGTDRFIDGSPLVAYREAKRTGTDFTVMHLADEEPSFCEALEKRLAGAKLATYPLDSETAAATIANRLRNNALNVGFLDPYNLGDLPITIFETFATVQKVDLLIHVSAMDLARQLPGSMTAESAPLDRFAPRWREAVAGLPPSVEARGRIIEHWVAQIRTLGFKDSKVWKLIRGPNSQPLYWLVLVAKHPLATQFWDDVNKPPQTSLDFGS